MTKTEVGLEFMKQIKKRRPIEYARQGNTWYVKSENVLNGGKPIDGLFEIIFYKMNESDKKFTPVTILQLPEDLNFSRR